LNTWTWTERWKKRQNVLWKVRRQLGTVCSDEIHLAPEGADPVNRNRSWHHTQLQADKIILWDKRNQPQVEKDFSRIALASSISPQQMYIDWRHVRSLFPSHQGAQLLGVELCCRLGVSGMTQKIESDPFLQIDHLHVIFEHFSCAMQPSCFAPCLCSVAHTGADGSFLLGCMSSRVARIVVLLIILV
jgi:hypothetical protein